MSFVIAIDGPAGSGKSTISKEIAKKLNFTHIDTGAMYRAVTLEALKRKIDVYNDNYDFLNEIDINYELGKIYLNGKDVSDDVRSIDVTNNVSIVAKNKLVREKMTELQRIIASKNDSILDGRDIGYTVLPNADLKIFLTASIDERAKRRYLDNLNRGINEPIEIIKEDIKKRDYDDENREISPLRMAHDAILLDTSNMKPDEVIDTIINMVKERNR